MEGSTFPLRFLISATNSTTGAKIAAAVLLRKGKGVVLERAQGILAPSARLIYVHVSGGENLLPWRATTSVDWESPLCWVYSAPMPSITATLPT